MKIDEIVQITNGWEKKERLKFAALCGRFRREGLTMGEAMIQAYLTMVNK